MIQEFEKVPNPADEDPAPGPRPIGSWLPAGAYAEAVVLAGVDASVGVSSQGDPRPVLLQADGQGQERGREDGEALEADVAGCTLTGAAYGDLSSEKIYVRLQTMTCAGQETGSVIETKVTGFVAGRREGRRAGSGGEPRRSAGGKGLLGGSGIRRGGDRGQPASNPNRDGGRRERGGPPRIWAVRVWAPALHRPGAGSPIT